MYHIIGEVSTRATTIPFKELERMKKFAFIDAFEIKIRGNYNDAQRMIGRKIQIDR